MIFPSSILAGNRLILGYCHTYLAFKIVFTPIQLQVLHSYHAVTFMSQIRIIFTAYFHNHLKRQTCLQIFEIVSRSIDQESSGDAHAQP